MASREVTLVVLMASWLAGAGAGAVVLMLAAWLAATGAKAVAGICMAAAWWAAAGAGAGAWAGPSETLGAGAA